MAITEHGIGDRSFSLRLLLTCGIIGPLLFIVVFLIEGATRADYSPLRHPISSLSIGEFGWMQVANFVVTGALMIVFAVGLRRVLGTAGWGPMLLGLVGIGLIGSGIFITDPLNGYPPGTPLLPTVRTVHGILHDLFGIPVFLGLPIAGLVFGRRFRRLGERGWATYSVFAGIAMFVIFIPARAGFSQRALAEFPGVFQRVSLMVGLTWIALLAVHVLLSQQTNDELER
jgi:hypothetical membrane protein